MSVHTIAPPPRVDRKSKTCPSVLILLGMLIQRIFRTPFFQFRRLLRRFLKDVVNNVGKLKTQASYYHADGAGHVIHHTHHKEIPVRAVQLVTPPQKVSCKFIQVEVWSHCMQWSLRES